MLFKLISERKNMIPEKDSKHNIKYEFKCDFKMDFKNEFINDAKRYVKTDLTKKSIM